MRDFLFPLVAYCSLKVPKTRLEANNSFNNGLAASRSKRAMFLNMASCCVSEKFYYKSSRLTTISWNSSSHFSLDFATGRAHQQAQLENHLTRLYVLTEFCLRLTDDSPTVLTW